MSVFFLQGIKPCSQFCLSHCVHNLPVIVRQLYDNAVIASRVLAAILIALYRVCRPCRLSLKLFGCVCGGIFSETHITFTLGNGGVCPAQPAQGDRAKKNPAMVTGLNALRGKGYRLRFPEPHKSRRLLAQDEIKGNDLHPGIPEHGFGPAAVFFITIDLNPRP